MTVAFPLYDTLARGFRPGLRDFSTASVAAAAPVAIVLPIDLATGWNYGFVGPGRPEVPTIVDLLGMAAPTRVHRRDRCRRDGDRAAALGAATQRAGRYQNSGAVAASAPNVM